MGATSIFFDGRLITKPGSVTKVDASGLETTGLGASGIVAIIGTAVGGKPISAITKASEIARFRRPETMRSAFRSGQLREATGFLFEPAKDPEILGGAQEVLCLKTNPATQGTVNLAKSSVNQILLTSKDYGEFVNQINVELANGTNAGKKLTARFEDLVEVGDDLGGVEVATLTYDAGTLGFDTVTATLDSSANLTATGTRASIGLAGSISNASLAAVEVVSSNAGDTTQSAIVFGLIGGVLTRRVVALNGTTPVSVTGAWDAGTVLGFKLSATCLGTVTLRNVTGPTTIGTITTGNLAMGVLRCEACYVNRTNVSVVLDGAGTTQAYVVGLDAAGAIVSAIVTMNGTTPVDTSGAAFAEITDIVLGGIAGARTFTLTAEAVKTLGTTHTTLQKVADHYNARSITGPKGFAFEIVTGETTYAMAKLDSFTASNIRNTVLDINADLDAIVRWVTNNSAFLDASRVSGATGAPDNTVVPAFLSGGSEGTALFSHYQAALDLLKQVRVNTVVDLSGDAAVAAALDAHCAYMCGAGKSERDGVAGIVGGSGGNPTKTEIKAAIVAVNSRHVRMPGQSVQRFNTSGEKETFLPPFYAAQIAGMQAGCGVGTPLTGKFMNALEVTQHSSWNPVDDAEEMIQMGLLFAEPIDGKGVRIVRNITTHLTTSNIAFVEGSVNQAVNFAVFEFRNTMEYAVGKKGFAGTIGVTRGLARTKLGLLVDEEIIVGWRALNIELELDVMDVNVELAPVIPINFVTSTIHLVTLAQLAAASAR
jgi:hypothetical protein